MANRLISPARRASERERLAMLPQLEKAARILEAVRRLPALSRRRVKDRPLLPREVDADLVPALWKRAVFSNASRPGQGLRPFPDPNSPGDAED